MKEVKKKKRKALLILTIIISGLMIITSCSDPTKPEDTTPPEVMITYPANNAEVEAGIEVTITAEATDNETVKKVTFYINEQQQYEDTSSPYSYNWDTTDLTGTFNLYAKAIDQSNNEATSDLVSVTLLEVPVGFVFVEAGTFEMGDQFNEGNDDELPLHNVTVSSFYMAKTEVTQSEYEAVMGNNPAGGYGVGDDFPVYYVSWYDAVDYCNALSIQEGLTPCYSGSGTSTTCDWNANGYRLPTEAEWEYAARGGIHYTDNYKYSGTTNSLEDYAWYDSNNIPNGSKEVGTKLPNQLGLYDMSGNEWEWCLDWYDNDYYSSSPDLNPHGANYGTYRVRRGGPWGHSDYRCRVAFRAGTISSGTGADIGFRILRITP